MLKILPITELCREMRINPPASSEHFYRSVDRCHVVKNLVVDRDFDIGFRYGVGFYDDFRLSAFVMTLNIREVFCETPGPDQYQSDYRK